MKPAEVVALIKEKEVKFVDFRFTDTKGKEQHVSVPARTVDEDLFEDGATGRDHVKRHQVSADRRRRAFRLSSQAERAAWTAGCSDTSATGTSHHDS